LTPPLPENMPRLLAPPAKYLMPLPSLTLLSDFFKVVTNYLRFFTCRIGSLCDSL
jgi:hypothetical protein